MAEYAGVIVDISLEKLDRVFDYRIPAHLQKEIVPGTQVWIPFGAGNRKIRGFVLSLADSCGYAPEKIKEIDSLCEGAVSVEGQLIALAEWMRAAYGCTMNQALKTVLPVKIAVQKKQKYFVSLVKNDQDILKYTETNRRCRARIRILKTLLSGGCMEKEALLKKSGTTAAVLKELEVSGMISVKGEDCYRLPEIVPEQRQNVLLSEEQLRVLRAFASDRAAGAVQRYLLYGVTGSGKTEVYIRMIEQVLQEGRQAIVLIPEIALTFQTVGRFYGRFGERVSVLHSKMSAGERSDQMERARNGEISVMIGPRSAVFTPFSKLGIIIVDEEHENSYKSETVPRYHAREVSQKRCDLTGASLVLGSATPSVESFYRAKHGELKLLKMRSRIGEAELAKTQIIDLRQELKSGNRSVLGSALREAMQEALEKKQQIMLFLNRRGLTGFISCRSCGEVLKCPHCDVSLTLHKNGKLCCHYCGYEQGQVRTCPHCGSPYIGGFRAGTQQIEEVVRREFPEAGVLRMDMDTTRKKGSYEAILKSFAEREADILIGTQMIVKGHDFPGVTVVGVLLADLSLHASDYMAAERTFQLLAQAAGRAGRGEEEGKAFIQTYQPEHYSIRAAAAQDYEGFYQLEIAYRELMSYPPVAGMMALLLLSENEELLDAEAERIKERILQLEIPLLCVTGPAPAAVAKISDVYRRVLYLKHEDREVLKKVRDRLEAEASKEAFHEKEIRLEFDENPLHAY